MSTRGVWRRLGVCAVMVVAAAGVQAWAEEPTSALPTVDEVVQKMITSYRSLSTYQDSGTLTDESILADGTEEFPAEPAPATVVYARGPRLRVTSPWALIACDGSLVTVYDSVSKEYTVKPYAPEMWEQRLGPYGTRSVTGVVGRILVAEDAVGAYKSLLREAKVSAEELVGAYDCWVVEGSVAASWVLPIGFWQGVVRFPPLRVRVWHRKEDGLVVQCRADLAQVLKLASQLTSEGIPVPDRVVMTYNAGEMRLNEEVPEDTFKFEPPAGAQKVESFMPAFGEEEGEEAEEEFGLKGKPAPDFELPGADGQPVKLSAFAGKVVVLDFWASWWGPCCDELPHIEEFWQTVKDKDVVVLGVNVGDHRQEADAAIKRLGLTFLQAFDSEQKVCWLYGVGGIPCTMVVDKEGILRERHAGFSADIGDELAEEIAGLLGAPKTE